MKDLALALERRIDRTLGPPLVAALALFAPREEPGEGASEPKRILLVKLHGIGNVVLLLPALRQLRRRYPGAGIDFLSFRSNAELLDGVEELSGRHLIERGAPWRLLLSTIKTVAALRRRRYDLVVDFDQFAHFSSVLALLSGAPRRIGFRNPTLHRHLAYTTPVVYLDMAHISRTFCRLAEAAGAVHDPATPRALALSPAHEEEARAFLAAEGIAPGERVVVLHPGTSENLTLRRWPAPRFAALADRLAAECGARIVISGGPEERGLAEEVKGGMAAPAVNAAGSLSFAGFAALCRIARLVVANDTAAVHVASAMGAPVAGLYGPNTPFLYGPLGKDDLVFYRQLPCSPCLSNLTSKLSHCRRARCMEALTVDELFTAIRRSHFPP
jgi:heptosyltransferase III